MASLRTVVSLTLVALLSACGDPSAPDTPATMSDFAGVWKGKFVYSVVNGASKDTGSFSETLTLTLSGNTLTGTETSEGEANPVPVANVSVVNGTLTFSFTQSAKEASHPDCVGFNLRGNATLDATRRTMTLVPSGRACGTAPATLTGSATLTKS